MCEEFHGGSTGLVAINIGSVASGGHRKGGRQ